MGGSSWSDDFYTDRTADRAKRKVDTFDYSRKVTTGEVAFKVNDKLNIRNKLRESRDSDIHPESTAIAVICDVTGSMATVPKVVQSKLPSLMGLLLRKGYIKDPQVLFGAVGDYRSDKIPLQIGQFESGIEMDDDITNIVLEGGGGGSNEESYQDALYFFAHRTSIDCFEKRGKKGYLFLIGDEKCYPQSTKDELSALIVEGAQSAATLEEIVSAAKEKYNIFFIIPKGTSNYNSPLIQEHWGNLIGAQNVIKLDDPAAICEAIGLAIGLYEGTVDPDSDAIARDLKELKAPETVVKAATKGLDALAKSTALTRKSTGDLPEKKGRSDKTERL